MTTDSSKPVRILARMEAIRNGAKMELTQESLGHHSSSNTQNYWAGFKDDVKQEIADKLKHFA